MAVVYQHRRHDTNEIFYIGIGVASRRSKSKHGRNKHWHNIVNKTGYSIEILFDDISREEAIEVEIYLIKYYGRRDLGTGSLVNMTGGGDGHLNPTEEQIEKMRQRQLGNVHSDSTKLKMKEAQKRGKHSQAKKVIDITTGEIFDCLKDVSDKYGIKYTYLKDNLKRTLVNKTNFKYL